MRRFQLFLAGAFLTGCTSLPPKNPANVCAIFSEKDDWYLSARDAERRWGAPIPVQMAIINQESSFVEDARPPRYRFLGFLPLWRPTSAYGYGQATDATWDWYREQTGRSGADRDEFPDVVDFIGWYTHQTQQQLGIPKSDAYRQYLAYHEGHGGFRRGTYQAKDWLQRAARRVADQAGRYTRQLFGCRASLETEIAAR